MADPKHIAIGLETRSEFFAQIAACPGEQKAWEFERGGWRVEHDCVWFQ
jgi:hypothetical protein